MHCRNPIFKLDPYWLAWIGVTFIIIHKLFFFKVQDWLRPTYSLNSYSSQAEFWNFAYKLVFISLDLWKSLKKLKLLKTLNIFRRAKIMAPSWPYEFINPSLLRKNVIPINLPILYYKIHLFSQKNNSPIYIFFL